jgi:hypothetical protein
MSAQVVPVPGTAVPNAVLPGADSKQAQIRARQREKYRTTYKAVMAAKRRAEREAIAEQSPEAYMKYREAVRDIRAALGSSRKENVLQGNFARKVMALLLVSGSIRCVVCQCEDIRVLAINHINGDGHKDKKRKKNRAPLYAEIVAGQRKVDDLEVTCANCNVLHEYKLARRKIPLGAEQIQDAVIDAWRQKVAK